MGIQNYKRSPFYSIQRVSDFIDQCLIIFRSIGNYDFAKYFWSYVFKNVKAEKLVQTIRVFWGHPEQRGATIGTPMNYMNYVEWFVKNIPCIPTTLNTCEIASKIFVDTKEIKELGGLYIPFLSIQLPRDKNSWYRILQLKTKFLLDDYFDLLEKIREDENELKSNYRRIQMIYSNLLDRISSWSLKEQRVIQIKTKKIYLLSENNQWELAENLFMYMEDNGTNNNLKETIPCLKLDHMNKKHPNLEKFLNLFNIKTLSMKDLELVHIGSSPAEEFRRKLIETSPFLKKWLKHSNYSPDDISSIDTTIQQEIAFFESDCLKLLYKGKFSGEADVYNDVAHKKFYVIRPWNGATAFIDLPKQLCQLLNIVGFEQNLGFLLRAQKEEIIKRFKKMSIEITTEKDAITLKSSPVKKTETTQNLPNAFTSSSVNAEQKSIDTNIKEINNKPENRKMDLKVRDNYLSKESSKEINPTLNKRIRSLTIESDGESLDNLELIDIPSIPVSSMFLPKKAVDLDDLTTGREGEYAVYQYLLNKYRSQSNTVLIEWKNEREESHLPYDILLYVKGIKNYIEVKSTRGSDRHSFPLSIQQIDAISEHTENYFIYRVYLDKKKLLILNKIKWRLQHKQHLSCFLTIE